MRNLGMIGRLAAVASVMTIITATGIESNIDKARATTAFNDAAMTSDDSLPLCRHDPESILGKGGAQVFAASIRQINHVFEEHSLTPEKMMAHIASMTQLVAGEREEMTDKMEAFASSQRRTYSDRTLANILSINAAPVTPYFTAIHYNHAAGIAVMLYPELEPALNRAADLLNTYITEVEMQTQCTPPINPYAPSTPV